MIKYWIIISFLLKPNHINGSNTTQTGLTHIHNTKPEDLKSKPDNYFQGLTYKLEDPKLKPNNYTKGLTLYYN